MANPNVSNIGSFIKVANGTLPRAAAAGATNGASIDRLGYGSCVLTSTTGATSGTPTSFGVAVKIQHSADNSSFSDLSGAAIALTTADSTASLAVDLSLANRYIRVVDTAAFVGGSSPTVLVHSSVVLGGAAEKPAV